MAHTRVSVAVTVHDRGGWFLPGLRRQAEPLSRVFAGIAAQITTQTDRNVDSFLVDTLGAVVGHAPADGSVGLHRRRAVELALRWDRPILYADLDHLLRWIEADVEEVGRVISLGDEFDLLIVGRTADAMAACPKRLRDTEAIINHLYLLITSRPWDLMFGIRLLSKAAADIVVRAALEDSVANDVEWPLLVERQGLRIGYTEAAGLTYRTAADFDTPADRRDTDPRAWIERVALANAHAQAMLRFLPDQPQ